jgi:hypothetical protein
MIDLSQNIPVTAKTFIPITETTNFSTEDPRQKRENYNNNLNTNNTYNREQRPKREFNNTNPASSSDVLGGPPVFVGKVKCINEIEEKVPKEVKEVKVIKETAKDEVDIDRPVFINSAKNIDAINEQVVEKNFSQLEIQDVRKYNFINFYFLFFIFSLLLKDS